MGLHTDKISVSGSYPSNVTPLMMSAVNIFKENVEKVCEEWKNAYFELEAQFPIFADASIKHERHESRVRQQHFERCCHNQSECDNVLTGN